MAFTEGLWASEPVRCEEKAGSFTLDNGIVRAVIEKRSGNLISLRLRGQELLAQNGGYWSSVSRGNSHGAGLRGTICTNTAERVEVSCRSADAVGVLQADFRYALARGDSQIYVTAIFHHAAGSASYSSGESRYCVKLNSRVFDFLVVDENRRRLMPSGDDWNRGITLNVKEARRLTTGVHKGEVEHKYDYSAVLTETPAYGWFSTKKHLGLWLINPSQEYIGGGPTKVELTGHLDVNEGGTPTLLNMWQGSHYGGTSLSVNPNEDWTKVIGPFAIYCNEDSTDIGAWQNALAQAASESQLWPYAWFHDENYPPAAERATVSGKIILSDAFDAGATMSNLWVGVSAPDYFPPGRNGSWRSAFPRQVEWQRDAKFYQFWARADADGRFTIHNIRPGQYTLHAFADGVLGEFAQTNVSLKAEQNLNLGQLIWQPKRFGRTVWQIGLADRTAAEFRHGDHYWQWGLYYLYPSEFPHDVNFIIGQSDWRRDWNYAQPPRITGAKQPVINEDDETGGANNNSPAETAPRNRGLQESTWKIQFQMTNAPVGSATLRLAFAGARDGCEIFVNLNGQDIGSTGPLPATGVMHRDGIRGYWFERDLTFDARRLRPGTNVFSLTCAAKNWTQGVLYDCVRLELDEK